MKKRAVAVIACVVAAVIAVPSSTAIAQSQRFPDVPADHYAFEAVEWAAEAGVTTGYNDGTFRPQQPLSKSHAVVFMQRYYDEILGAEQSDDFTRADMMVLLKAINDGTLRDTETTEADDAEDTETKPISYIDGEVSELDKAVPFLYSWATYNQGTKPVHVFYCARKGKYSNEDLSEVVDLLNSEISPKWMRESSNLLNLVFTEGSIISPDLAWDSVLLGRARNVCGRDALQAVYPSRDFSGSPGLIPEQILLLVDTPTRWHDGYGGNSHASSATQELLGLQRFLYVVSHELGHSKIGLHHTLVDCPHTLMVNPTGGHIATEICVDGGKTLGSGVAGVVLACYERRLLGWPTGGDSPPCGLLPPSSPSASLSSVTDDGLVVQWTPPIFSDDVPVDGYTLTVMREDSGGLNVHEQHRLSAEERSLAVDSLPVGRYSIRLWAESEYGSGAQDWIGSIPLVPSPVSVTATAIDSTSFRVSWSPVPGASYYLVWNSEDDPPTTIQFDEDGNYSRSYSGTNVRGGTSLVLHNREPDTDYTLKVLACGFEELLGSEECSFGTEATVSTKPSEPATTTLGTVSSVSIAESGDDWLVLSWAAAPGATNYECGYLTAANTWLVGPGTADISCELWWDSRRVAAGIGLVAGNTYTVGVRACQGFTCSEWATTTGSTLSLSPAPASYAVAVKEVGDTRFTLSWNPPAADSYFDLRVVTGLSRTFRVTGRTRDVTVPGLQPNTGYTVKVRTCRGTGGYCSSWVTIPVSTLGGS